MQFEKGNFLDVLLKMFCLSATIGTTLWCCYEFSKNEDMCEVIFKSFLQDDDSVYPDLTIMIPHQVNDTALRMNFGEGIDASVFRNFLQGSYWNDQLLNIRFADINLQLEDYVKATCVKSSFFEDCREIETIISEYSFGLESHTFRFARDKEMMFASVQLSTSIFSNGNRPFPGELIIMFQYPNRVYRSRVAMFGDPSRGSQWPAQREASSSNYRMKFGLSNMEVLRRRHKKGQECLDVENYDKAMMEDIAHNVGCRPHYWNISGVARVCNKQEEVQRFFTDFVNRFYRVQKAKNDFPPPCLEIQRLRIDYSEENVNEAYSNAYTPNGNGTWFEVLFEIQTDTFKEIKQNRAYSIQSLIGNLGGYLGIFLGYALVDFVTVMFAFYAKIRPAPLSFLYNSHKRLILRKKNKTRIEGKN